MATKSKIWRVCRVLWCTFLIGTISEGVITEKISPWYHAVFDEKFLTVNLLPSEDSLEDQRARIFKFQQE